MLLPDKHTTLAESIIGLGAFVLRELKRPKTFDELYKRVSQKRETKDLPANHDAVNLTLAVLFLFAVEAIELGDDGSLRRCA